MNTPLWKPSEKKVQESAIEDFAKFINFKSNKNFKELWKWSVDNPELFWSKFWDYSKIIGDKGKDVIKKNNIFYKTKFFPDSRINYSENILKKKIMISLLAFYLKVDLKKILHGNFCMKKYVSFRLI